MVQNTWQFQGRQQHGEFGHGTAPHTSPPTTDPIRRQLGRENPAAPDLAKRTAYVAHGVVGHLAPAAQRFYEAWLAGGLLASLRRMVAAHPAAAHLDDEAYRTHMLGQALTAPETRLLRRAADLIHGARTLDDLAPAATALAGVVRSAGLPRTASAVATAAAATVPPKPPPVRPPIIPVQEILLPLARPLLFGRPFLFADPPKLVPPRVFPDVPDEFRNPPRDPRFPWPRRFKEAIPKQSGKEGAKNRPDWAAPYKPWEGETPIEYAERMMRWKKPGRFLRGAGEEFSQLKKWASRHFRDPKPPKTGKKAKVLPFDDDDTA